MSPAFWVFLVHHSFSRKEMQEGEEGGSCCVCHHTSHSRWLGEKRWKWGSTTEHTLRYRQKRLDLLWYIDNKEEMRLQILPVTNIQPLDFETKTAFWKTLLEDFVSSSTMCLHNIWAYKNAYICIPCIYTPSVITICMIQHFLLPRFSLGHSMPDFGASSSYLSRGSLTLK